MTEDLEFFERAVDAVRSADTYGLLDHERQVLVIEVLTGYSGSKLVGALQRLCRLFQDDDSACYLEIGVFQGLTLNSVASANPGLPCFGVDNFAFFDPKHENMAIVKARMAALGNDNAQLINADYEDALSSLDSYLNGRKIGVYFIDGPHDYRSQLMCLELALPYLHERAIVVVDDCNYEHVRQANADFLRTHNEWALFTQAYTSAHPSNLDVPRRKIAESGWWNGVNVLCRDPAFLIARELPPTPRSRERFENDHLVHPHRMAPMVVECLAVADALVTFSPARMVRAIMSFFRKYKTCHQKLGGFTAMNTNSERLDEFSTADISSRTARNPPKSLDM